MFLATLQSAHRFSIDARSIRQGGETHRCCQLPQRFQTQKTVEEIVTPSFAGGRQSAYLVEPAVAFGADNWSSDEGSGARYPQIDERNHQRGSNGYWTRRKQIA